MIKEMVRINIGFGGKVARGWWVGKKAVEHNPEWYYGAQCRGS